MVIHVKGHNISGKPICGEVDLARRIKSDESWVLALCRFPFDESNTTGGVIDGKHRGTVMPTVCRKEKLPIRMHDDFRCRIFALEVVGQGLYHVGLGQLPFGRIICQHGQSAIKFINGIQPLSARVKTDMSGTSTGLRRPERGPY